MPKCVASNLALLEASRNPDGGWGYFAGKQSCLEPTVYALLALSSQPSRGDLFDRGWRLLKSWELPEGGWRAGAGISQVHWAGSLAVTLYGMRGIYDESFERGVRWLMALKGSEGRPVARLAHWIQPHIVEFDAGVTGWPWQEGTSSWVEPTAHALMALRRAAPHTSVRGVAERIIEGQRMLLDRRCADGGWNYGNRRILGADLPSYPETTALALMALNGNPGVAWGEALGEIERRRRETRSPLARAWLGACLLQHCEQCGGEQAKAAAAEPSGGMPDIVVNAVEAIAWDKVSAL